MLGHYTTGPSGTFDNCTDWSPGQPIEPSGARNAWNLDSCQRCADLRVQRIRFAEQPLGVLELTPMDGANGVGAGADELARPAQSLFAGRVLAIELSSRPAFDRTQVETAHLNTISRRLLPL